MSLSDIIATFSVWGDTLEPQMEMSQNYKHWVSVEDLKRCVICEENHGKIWSINDAPNPEPPIHPNCRCSIQPMQSILAGTATIKENNGADWYLKNNGKLPDYYISKIEAKQKGWKPSKWPSNFIGNNLIAGGIYHNDDGHLPIKDDRIWYEADINYKTGKRNNQRIVWSNDGLIFVTYDHYETFYEII